MGVDNMNETFWKWFKNNIDGKFLTQSRVLVLMHNLREMNEGIRLDVGNGYTEIGPNGTLVSKQEMIFIAENEGAKQIVIELASSAPALSTWEIRVSF